jgi:hypothetical protein
MILMNNCKIDINDNVVLLSFSNGYIAGFLKSKNIKFPISTTITGTYIDNMEFPKQRLIGRLYFNSYFCRNYTKTIEEIFQHFLNC